MLQPARGRRGSDPQDLAGHQEEAAHVAPPGSGGPCATAHEPWVPRAPPALSSTTGLKVILGLVDVRGGASEGFGACPVVGEGSRYTPGERSDS